MPGAARDIFKRRKIVVLGSRSVGKSSLVMQYLENHFTDLYHPTIENTFNKSIALEDVEYDCDIIDTAGQDEFSILNAKYAIGIHGYVLVYSVTSRSSFDMVKIVYDKIIDFSGLPSVPAVVVGSKVDLARREVSAQEAQELANKMGCAFIETSAQNNLNTAKVFELCLGEIEKRYKPRRAPQSQTNDCCMM